MQPDQPAEPGNNLAASIRRHVDNLNRQLVSVSAGFQNIEAMAAAIDNHLNEIGLENIGPKKVRNKR